MPGDGNLAIVQLGEVGCAVDVHLSALAHVDLVQPLDIRNAGQVADIAIHRSGIRTDIEPRQAAELHVLSRLVLGKALAALAVHRSHPERVVVGKNHLVVGPVADGVLPGHRRIRQVHNAEISRKQTIGLHLLARHVEGRSVLHSICDPAWHRQ